MHAQFKPLNTPIKFPERANMEIISEASRQRSGRAPGQLAERTENTGMVIFDKARELVGEFTYARITTPPPDSLRGERVNELDQVVSA